MRRLLSKYGRDLAGLAGHAAVVFGLWGRFGWACAAVAAGLPFAAFYFWGEYRSARGDG